MLLWTNDPNWAIADPSPDQLQGPTKALELFLFQFQDRRFHEHLTGDCDIAFLNLQAVQPDGSPACPMALRLVIPRDEGTRREVLDWWHPATAWHWKHSGVEISDRGWTGSPAAAAEHPNRRYKVETYLDDVTLEPGSCLDAVDLYPHNYPRYLAAAQRSRLVPFGVGVADDRKLLELTPMARLSGFKHQEFTLSREYEQGDYAHLLNSAS
jgi:hypothetical protein